MAGDGFLQWVAADILRSRRQVQKGARNLSRVSFSQPPLQVGVRREKIANGFFHLHIRFLLLAFCGALALKLRLMAMNKAREVRRATAAAARAKAGEAEVEEDAHAEILDSEDRYVFMT